MTAAICPKCGVRDLYWHATCVWCMTCGWARNRHPDPTTGRPIEHPSSAWWTR